MLNKKLLFLLITLHLISCGKKQEHHKSIGPKKIINYSLVYEKTSQILNVEGFKLEINPSSFVIQGGNQYVSILDRLTNQELLKITKAEMQKKTVSSVVSIDKSTDEFIVFAQTKTTGLKFVYKDIQKSKNLLDQHFVRDAKSSIQVNPSEREIIITTDTGFGRSLDGGVLNYSSNRGRGLQQFLNRYRGSYLIQNDKYIMLEETERSGKKIVYTMKPSVNLNNSTENDFTVQKEINKVNAEYIEIKFIIEHHEVGSFAISNPLIASSIHRSCYGLLKDLTSRRVANKIETQLILRNDLYKKCFDKKPLTGSLQVFDENINMLTLIY